MITLRDYQHASRLLVSDNQKLAPKLSFLFHVYFGINKQVVTDKYIIEKYPNELGMLVKNVNLPAFKIKHDTKNQYNRKKNYQYTHEFEEVSIKFHDDNASLILSLWKNYYQYYYADPTTSKIPNAYDRNAVLNYSYMKNPYGLDNNSKIPFFKYINIYQLSRGSWISFTYINPLIVEFSHTNVDYAAQEPHEMDMKIKYEAVYYDNGIIEDGEPYGFAKTHYDLTPSPLELNDYSQILPEQPTQTSTYRETLNNSFQSKNIYYSNNFLSNIEQSGISTPLPEYQTISGFDSLVFPIKNNNSITKASIKTL